MAHELDDNAQLQVRTRHLGHLGYAGKLIYAHRGYSTKGTIHKIPITRQARRLSVAAATASGSWVNFRCDNGTMTQEGSILTSPGHGNVAPYTFTQTGNNGWFAPGPAGGKGSFGGYATPIAYQMEMVKVDEVGRNPWWGSMDIITPDQLTSSFFQFTDDTLSVAMVGSDNWFSLTAVIWEE